MFIAQPLLTIAFGFAFGATAAAQDQRVNVAGRWRLDARKLTSTVARELNVRGSVTVTQYREVMYLTPEGLLVLETTVSGNPAGRKAVYRRIDP